MVESLNDKKFTIAFNDVNGLVDRVSNYTFLNYSAEYTSNNSVSYDNKLSIADNVCSVIEGLGIDLFRKFLPDEEINAFTKNLQAHKKQYLELLSEDPAGQQKLNKKIGLINATLKGLSIKGYTEAIEKNIEDKDQRQDAVAAVNKAMIEVIDTDKKDYITALQNKTTEILKDSKKYNDKSIENIIKNISPNNLKKEFNEEQHAALSQASVKAAQQIGKIFQSPDEIATYVEELHKNRFLRLTNLNKDGQKQLSEKLETIKPLWAFQESNYSDKNKAGYLNNPSQLSKKEGVEKAFEEITKTLAEKTAPEHLAKAMPPIAEAAPSVVGSIIAKQCTEKLAKQSNLKLDQKVKDKIFNKLEKELSDVDPQVLGNNSEKFMNQISSSLNKNKSFFSYFTGKYDISNRNLDKIIKETKKETERLKQSSTQLPLPPQNKEYWEEAKPTQSIPTPSQPMNIPKSNPIPIPQANKKEELNMPPNHIPNTSPLASKLDAIKPPPLLSEAWGLTNNSNAKSSKSIKPSPTPEIAHKRKGSHSLDI